MLKKVFYFTLQFNFQVELFKDMLVMLEESCASRMKTNDISSFFLFNPSATNKTLNAVYIKL